MSRGLNICGQVRNSCDKAWRVAPCAAVADQPAGFDDRYSTTELMFEVRDALSANVRGRPPVCNLGGRYRAKFVTVASTGL
jgi:hypothetical protein